MHQGATAKNKLCNHLDRTARQTVRRGGRLCLTQSLTEQWLTGTMGFGHSLLPTPVT